MKTFYRLFVWLLIAVFSTTLAGCKDDDDPVEPTTESLLTADEWIGNSIYANGENITELVRHSEKFDVRNLKIKFNKDGTYEDNNYGVKSVGKWEFSDDKKIIFLDKGTPKEWSFIMTKLTNQELYLVDKFKNGQGGMIDGEMRFTK